MDILRTIRDHAWTPYLATYGGFLLILQAAVFLPSELRPWVIVPQVLVPGALLLHFLGRRSYPELLGLRPTPRDLILDAMVGLGTAALWVVPYLAGWLGHPPESSGFQPAALLGERFSYLSLGLRFIGFCLVTPFIEELFVRSFLLRSLDGLRSGVDFRAVPIAHFGWVGFILTVVYFTFSHASWEWPVAFLAGLAYNGWLYHRRNIGSTILAHAVTNTSIFMLVVGFPDRVMTGGRGLWYFL